MRLGGRCAVVLLRLDGWSKGWVLTQDLCQWFRIHLKHSTNIDIFWHFLTNTFLQANKMATTYPRWFQCPTCRYVCPKTDLKSLMNVIQVIKHYRSMQSVYFVMAICACIKRMWWCTDKFIFAQTFVAGLTEVVCDYPLKKIPHLLLKESTPWTGWHALRLGWTQFFSIWSSIKYV